MTFVKMQKLMIWFLNIFLLYIMTLFQNAIMMCLPYMSAWICGVIFSTLASWILAKGYLSQVTSMKVFNSLGELYELYFIIFIL